MERELQKIPVEHDLLRLVSWAFEDLSVDLDNCLVLDKNSDYGDAWQAEGPFLAASRMKDKITRVTNIIDGRVSAETKAEGFQDIIEMMQYGKMLLAYWVWNDLGLSGSEVKPVKELYDRLGKDFFLTYDVKLFSPTE